MVVVDASVLVEALADDGDRGDAVRSLLLAEGSLAVPDVADVETVSVLRRQWLRGGISGGRLRAAVGDLEDLPVTRFPSAPLMRRAYELRQNVTPYDACYLALAEALGCELLTLDRRLARLPGVRCRVVVPAV